MKVKQFILGSLGLLSAGAVIGGGIIYPEGFAMTLVGLILGLFTGITLATILMESYFNKGVTMAHELQKQQVVNPAAIMRETRLAAKEEARIAPARQPKPKSQPIPQFTITGLDN